MPGSRGSCGSTDPITCELEFQKRMRDMKEFVGEVVQSSGTLEENVHRDMSYSWALERCCFADQSAEEAALVLENRGPD